MPLVRTLELPKRLTETELLDRGYERIVILGDVFYTAEFPDFEYVAIYKECSNGEFRLVK